MASTRGGSTQGVAVVTGGAAGIGAAIAEELGRNGTYVVTLDPMVTLDGSGRLSDSEPTTADRIVKAGGAARASNISVTDREAVPALFAELKQEFGLLDAVVNVAGIVRPTEFAKGTEADWAAVLSVHLEGYLNVLGSALPLMVEAGRGRILGVTSGSGWRPANTGAYGCAKRAVAALTWQIGQTTPQGVTVNALSPIAATRMVTRGTTPRQTGPAENARTGGLSLGAMPPPENLGPVGAYLASDRFSWCTGQVVFSGGSEVAKLTPPRLVEVCRSAEVRSLPHVLETVVPTAFIPAEVTQSTNGGSNPRFGPIFREAPRAGAGSDRMDTCVVITDDREWGNLVGDALSARGVTCLGLGAWSGTRLLAGEVAQGFEGAAAQLARAAKEGPVDGVVLALMGKIERPTPGVAEWRRVLDEHAGVPEAIRNDAGWARAVADYSSQAGRPVRMVNLIAATTSGGKSRAQAAAQLTRAAHTATADEVDAYSISIESAATGDRRAAAELAAHLLTAADTSSLSGAELVAGEGWLGLRSHPYPATSIAYGGPAIPEWLDGTLRQVVNGSAG